MPSLLHTHIYRPTRLLAAYVDCMWYRRGFIPNRRREYSMPTGSVDLVFNLNADCIRTFGTAVDRVGVCTNGALVHGAQSRSFVLDSLERVHFVGVHFRPGGGCLLGVPSQEIADRHVSLEGLWGAAATRLRERLLECDTPQALFSVLEADLLRRLQARRVVHPAISFALRRMHEGRGIASLRKETGYGERRFTNLFEQTVGLTPKKFSRVQRVSAALHRLARGADSLAQVAATHGYYDQAHFAHEFREIAGIAPSDYEPLSRSPLHMEVKAAAK